MVLALTTAPTQASAKTLAHQLIASRHAACVQISAPCESVYLWQGKVAQDTEYKLAIKTNEDNLSAAFDTICQLHPYDIPQWVVIRDIDASNDYLTWLTQSLAPNE